MLYRPTLGAEWGTGEAVVVVGAVLAILSLLSLNRSFGVVPARRSVKTRGMYRLVRHPASGSYLLLCLGYVLTNPSYFNMFILALTAALLVLRVEREEALLEKNEEYQRYQRSVRYKLLPGVY